jgi:hypothetical protein
MITARKITSGFIISPRTMPEMFYSAINGMFSLLTEKNRIGFTKMLENDTIQEEVLTQATAGPMMMLSLFHDLQNPLFKKCKFEPLVFLEGLAPALENFHNVSGALENELYEINHKALAAGISNTDDDDKKKVEQVDDNDDDSSNDNYDDDNNNNNNSLIGDITKEEKEKLLSVLRSFTGGNENNVDSEKQKKDAEAVLNYEWMKEAESNPESIAASLSRMVTKELFQINQLSSKTAFLLQSQSSKNNIMIREGSCEVNNVAILSARACLFKEKKRPNSEDNNEESNDEGFVREYEAVDFNYDDDEIDSENTAVAAQIEVLYDVTQEFVIAKSSSSSTSDSKEEEDTSTSTSENNSSKISTTEYTSLLDTKGEPRQTTIVSVATLEGWLKNGPDDDGELRWRLASYRPPYEFPGIEHAY